MDKNPNEEQTSEKVEKETPEIEESTEEVEENPEEEPERDAKEDSKNRQLYERTKKAEAEKKELHKELEILKAKQVDSDGDVPDTRIADLEAELLALKLKGEKDAVYSEYPVLNDKLEEFEEYLEANPGMKIQTAGKAFVYENDLLAKPTKRKGLEKGGRGIKNYSKGGKMSAEQVKTLRNSDYRRYMKLVQEGKIEIED